MTTTTEKITYNKVLIDLFEKNKFSGSQAIQALRKNAMDAFKQLELPTRKHEEYKYLAIDKLFKNELSLVSKQTTIDNSVLQQYQITELNANTIVLVNGVFNADLSNVTNLPKGAIVVSLQQAFEKYTDLIETHYNKYVDVNTDAFVALNTAFANDGLVVFIPENTIIEKPFHIINITNAGSLVFQRNLIVVGKNAQAKFIESFVSTDGNEKIVTNNVSEIYVGESAHVQYYKLQTTGEGLINTSQVKQEKNSHFDTNTVTLNSNWVRNNLTIVLNGQYCETHLNGLFLAKGNEVIDNHTLVDHQQPNCQSNQLYKGVLNDKSTGIFNGKIFVRKDAQKTNAYQSSKNILLSDDATINTKPQLEIYADDVKCSHGSSTGQIDEEALFYLRSRGLSVDSAKKILMLAFAEDAVNTINIEAYKNYVSGLIEEQLNK